MGIELDITKARNITRNIIREKREPILAKLDIEMLHAIEEGNIDKQQDILYRKRLLRDATKHPDIDSAIDTESLLKSVASALDLNQISK